ncbi:MAG: hypothetical protein AAB310_00010 [Nitrospirota bacterium]|nr:MAG: hypothetical protein A3J72_00965 [Nitrospirae bacterium RIFCSPHIGHO2_02_FULL_40_19]HLA49947.1 hypothetical protein [Thermodesulfovibrionia bacterium]
MNAHVMEKEKHYCVTTGKLHIPCPYSEKTGINTHVVIKDGYCYRSGQCMIVWCKFNRFQNDIDTILSVLW